ncbi:MAG: L-2-hydroxyglutarate oxidase [Bryobacter sp.]|nr:L-2-hydroxyglutarate oxidase [Bryobacter sp.]
MVTVIGCGIIGLAVGLRITQRFPHVSVALIDKESIVCRHQSGHNSGVLHAGLYYKPGSLKARLAVSGIRRMLAFCQEQQVAHEICGKLVVAVEESEVSRLRELHERGVANGLSGLRWLGPGEIREREPHVAGVAAVEVPEEGIVDYPGVCRAMQQEIETRGGTFHLGEAVEVLKRRQSQWHVNGRPADYVFNCAGLHCDRVMALTGEAPPVKIVPFRGEYFTLRPQAQHLVRHLIYPVPDPAFPFLGVHYTRMIHGGVECGPNAVLALAREAYGWNTFSLRDTLDAVTYSGLWKFMAKYPGMSWYEVKRSLSKAEFTRSLQRLVPAVQAADLSPGGAGVRAQAMAPDGTLLQDFSVEQREGILHLLNAPSPGATASLAIADYLIDVSPLAASL